MAESSPSVAQARMPCRVEEALVLRTLDGAVVLPPGEAIPMRLNRSAAEILFLCGRGLTLDEIALVLANEYLLGDPTAVSGDVDAVIGHLVDIGVLRWT